MKRISSIMIAAAFLVGCGAEDAPAADDVAVATPETAAMEEETAQTCDPQTDENCDHTGTVIVPPDRH